MRMRSVSNWRIERSDGAGLQRGRDVDLHGRAHGGLAPAPVPLTRAVSPSDVPSPVPVPVPVSGAVVGVGPLLTVAAYDDDGGGAGGRARNSRSRFLRIPTPYNAARRPVRSGRHFVAPNPNHNSNRARLRASTRPGAAPIDEGHGIRRRLFRLGGGETRRQPLQMGKVGGQGRPAPSPVAAPAVAPFPLAAASTAPAAAAAAAPTVVGPLDAHIRDTKMMESALTLALLGEDDETATLQSAITDGDTLPRPQLSDDDEEEEHAARRRLVDGNDDDDNDDLFLGRPPSPSLSEHLDSVDEDSVVVLGDNSPEEDEFTPGVSDPGIGHGAAEEDTIEDVGAVGAGVGAEYDYDDEGGMAVGFTAAAARCVGMEPQTATHASNIVTSFWRGRAITILCKQLAISRMTLAVWLVPLATDCPNMTFRTWQALCLVFSSTWITLDRDPSRRLQRLLDAVKTAVRNSVASQRKLLAHRRRDRTGWTQSLLEVSGGEEDEEEEKDKYRYQDDDYPTYVYSKEQLTRIVVAAMLFQVYTTYDSVPDYDRCIRPIAKKTGFLDVAGLEQSVFGAQPYDFKTWTAVQMVLLELLPQDANFLLLLSDPGNHLVEHPVDAGTPHMHP